MYNVAECHLAPNSPQKIKELPDGGEARCILGAGSHSTWNLEWPRKEMQGDGIDRFEPKA